jgi:glutamate--cysteine ligase
LANSYQQRLAVVSAARVQPKLTNIVRGIEKESLRVTPGGGLAQSAHPPCLGAALTNPYITTDYSEALLEFITPPCHDIDQLLACLDNIHRFTYQCLEQELLWTASMPCILRSDQDIPVAHYGSSNIGRMKEIYREGLGHRYGRAMQTISGIHYNFSMEDSFWTAYQHGLGNGSTLQNFKNDQYLALIRNFRRYAWLLIYLFGASPALCKSFIGKQQHTLDKYDEHTLYREGATSLRMGDLGYQSSAQENLVISYNSLDSYISSLRALLTQQHPAYQAIGTKDQNGQWRQLSTTLLQIENEFYSSIRPKQPIHSGEAPILALKHRGIEYVEVRALDVNPYLPLGIDKQQIRCLDLFLLYCLLQDSPELTVDEYHQNQANLSAVVNCGRTEGILLEHGDSKRPITQWAGEILEQIQTIAALLDQNESGDDYASALQTQRDKLANSRLTPSGQIMMDMRGEDIPWFHFAMNMSQVHADYFLQRPLSAADKAIFTGAAIESLAEQRRIEAADHMSLDDYLEKYYRQYQSVSHSPV